MIPRELQEDIMEPLQSILLLPFPFQRNISLRIALSEHPLFVFNMLNWYKLFALIMFLSLFIDCTLRSSYIGRGRSVLLNRCILKRLVPQNDHI